MPDLQAIRKRNTKDQNGHCRACGYSTHAEGCEAADVAALLDEIERLHEVTDEQVEAAAAAILEAKTNHGDSYYLFARVALEAARDA